MGTHVGPAPRRTAISWRRRRCRERLAAGATAAEALVVLAVFAIATVIGTVAVARLLRRQAAPAAARLLGSEIRLRRAEAISSARGLGLVFTEGAGGWTVSLYEDGDGDGIRSDDLARGDNPRREGPQPFALRYGAAQPGFLPGLEDLVSPPPSSTPLGALDDPIRFGRQDWITFSPRGSTSSGTVYLTDGSERQLAVVVYGATGRVREWEYDRGSRTWVQR